MAWINPVTNRTRGAEYTPEDLSRVAECVQYLADLLIGYGYSVTVEVKTDWTMEDLPTAALMETYLNNVKALISAYYTLPDTPEPPESMDFLTWQGANDIERVLVDIKEIIGKMKRSFKPCGTFKCGQGVILPRSLAWWLTYADLEMYLYGELQAYTYQQIRTGAI